jgi:hypothetical protein
MKMENVNGKKKVLNPKNVKPGHMYQLLGWNTRENANGEYEKYIDSTFTFVATRKPEVEERLDGENLYVFSDIQWSNGCNVTMFPEDELFEVR